MNDLSIELLFAGMGLHANATNRSFNPRPETILNWSHLMFRAYKEINRLEGEIRTANYMVDEALRKLPLERQLPEIAEVSEEAKHG